MKKITEEELEMISNFVDIPLGAEYSGQYNGENKNQYYFRVPARGQGILETSYGGSQKIVSNDRFTVSLSENEIAITDKITNGWREYRYDDDMGQTVEYLTDTVTRTKYSLKTYEDGTYLVREISKTIESGGMSDSWGGSKGIEYKEIEYEENSIAKVSEGYKLSDGLEGIEFKQEQKSVIK